MKLFERKVQLSGLAIPWLIVTYYKKKQMDLKDIEEGYFFRKSVKTKTRVLLYEI